MNNLYENKENCCGCTACYAVCPKNAIRMLPDREGFWYPVINEELCISCNLCKKVCPFKTQTESLEEQSIYACKNRNLDERINSSSGGIFSLICKELDTVDGVVYGAALDDKLAVKHMRSDIREDWRKFCVSKYVQSDMNDCFRKIKDDLQTSKKVLFSGTPCQVAGLFKMLGQIDISNLFTCDIICHGVPSPLIWHEYLYNYLNDDIGAISFRDKTDVGWHNSTITIYNRNNEIILKQNQSVSFFYKLFFNHLILRPSCHICPYANFERVGDITLGDYWGIERHYPEFDDDKGTSLVMCNSKKGETMFEKIKGDIEYIKIDRKQCIQPNLQSPSKAASNRDMFWKAYNKYGLLKTGKIIGLLPNNRVEKIYYKFIRKVVLPHIE